jgi:hypothetical protein
VRISPLLRNFGPVPLLPRPEICKRGLRANLMLGHRLRNLPASILSGNLLGVIDDHYVHGHSFSFYDLQSKLLLDLGEDGEAIGA